MKAVRVFVGGSFGIGGRTVEQTAGGLNLLTLLIDSIDCVDGQ